MVRCCLVRQHSQLRSTPQSAAQAVVAAFTAGSASNRSNQRSSAELLEFSVEKDTWDWLKQTMSAPLRSIRNSVDAATRAAISRQLDDDLEQFRACVWRCIFLAVWRFRLFVPQCRLCWFHARLHVTYARAYVNVDYRRPGPEHIYKRTKNGVCYGSDGQTILASAAAQLPAPPTHRVDFVATCRKFEFHGVCNSGAAAAQFLTETEGTCVRACVEHVEQVASALPSIHCLSARCLPPTNVFVFARSHDVGVWRSSAR